MTPRIAAAFPIDGLSSLVVAPIFLFVFRETVGKDLVDVVEPVVEVRA